MSRHASIAIEAPLAATPPPERGPILPAEVSDHFDSATVYQMGVRTFVGPIGESSRDTIMTDDAVSHTESPKSSEFDPEAYATPTPLTVIQIDHVKL